MLRENVAGLLSNSRGSLTRANSTQDISQRPLCSSSSVPTCDISSCGRKRPRSLASSSSVVLKRWDSDAMDHGDSTCPGCQHLVPILRAEIASLKKQLSRAKGRLRELGGAKDGGGIQDTESKVGVLKARIKGLLSRGNITTEQILEGKVGRKAVGSGSDSSLLQLALSDVQKEIVAENKRQEEDAERQAMENHDNKQNETEKCDPNANPDEILEETTWKLLECCEQTKQACAENHLEQLDVKPIYISARKIVTDGHAQLMRCPGGSVCKLLGKPDLEGLPNCGPEASEARQLLMEKYLDEEPPHDDLDTDTFDSLFHNDVRILARLTTGLHVLGLPGSKTMAIKEDAQAFSEFGKKLFNGDGSLDFVEALGELRDIVESRKAKQTLIYIRKLLDEALDQIKRENRPKNREANPVKPRRKAKPPQRWPPGATRAFVRQQ